MQYLTNQASLSTVKIRNTTKNIPIDISFAETMFSAELEKRKNITIAIIDSKVENYQQLAQGVKLGTEVIILDGKRDGIAQIAEVLATRHNINSIQIVAHGKAAAIELGSTELNLDNLENYSSELQLWGTALSEEGSIFLLSCNTAAGESGLEFIQKISQITGASIAASQNLTGNAALGGDWELEIAIGPINTELAFEKAALEAYTSVLATLVKENFQNGVIYGPWIYGTTGNSSKPGLTAGNGAGILPGLGLGDTPGDGALRLTSNAENQAAFVIYNNPISSTEGLKVTFEFFAYAGSAYYGTPGDGLSFFLIDGTATPTQAGAYGGSLGYAQDTITPIPGLVGGYLGIGFDEFGNFSNNNQGRVGGTGLQPDAVTLRGREATGYEFLTNTVVPGGIDNYTSQTRNSATRRVQITLDPSTSVTPNRLRVALDLNGNDSFTDAGETIIDILNLTTVNGAIPPTFKFGFASSTGLATDIHEVRTLKVESIDPPASQADIVTVKTGPQYARPQSTITYQITATNNGPNNAQNVLVQDQLPLDLTFVNADGGGNFNPETGAVTWPSVNLANGASITRTVTAVTPNKNGSIINTAFSSSTTYDPNDANNDGSQTLSQVETRLVAAVADVVTTKTGPATATAGSTVAYTITTANSGPDEATNVSIYDTIIPGLTGVSVSNGGSYDPVTGVVTFPAVPTLLNGAANAIARTVSFIAPNDTSVSNTASSTSTTPDSTPGNNNGTAATAKVTTSITPAPVPTPTPAPVPTPTPAPVPTPTPAPVPTPTPAPVPTPTPAPVPTPTPAPVPTPTPAPVPTPTPAPVPTPTPAPVPTPTPAPVPTPTPAPVPTPTPAPVPTPTPAPVPTPTPAPVPTPTPAPVPTPTPTNQPPVAANTNFSIAPNSITQVTGLGATDADGTIASYTINTLPPADQGLLFIGNPQNGGVRVTVGQTLTPEQIQQLFFQSTGNFTTADFNYSATDDRGAMSPATATVAVRLATPTPTNQPPVAAKYQLQHCTQQ
jgi:uncharacterized repeat protein (TIGR01451 family)